MIVYDKEQKEIVIPNGIGNINLFNNGVEAGYNQGKIDGIDEQKSKLESINITENGTYTREDGYNEIVVDVPDLNGDYNEGYAQGKIDGINEQKSKLESISITENGTYNKEDGYNHIEVNVPDLNGSYDEGYEQGQADVAANARVLNVTENGTYMSKFSDPIIPANVTGVYADGTKFYSYAELGDNKYNTGIKVSENTKFEIWYKPRDLGFVQNGGLIGTIYNDYNKTFSLYTNLLNGFVGKIGNTEGNYYPNDRNKWFHIELSLAEGFIIDGVNYGTYQNIDTEILGKDIYINKYEGSGGGYFGMVKINDVVFIPTADGFQNVNTGELLENISSGSYTFTENLPIYGEGELYKTINVDVKPKINVKEAGLKFGESTFTEVPEWADFEGVTDMSDMFNSCDNLLTIPQIDTGNVTNMESMFRYCYNLQTIPLLDTSNVTNMNYMFSYCRKLQSISLIDTSNVTNMEEMFSDCENLQTIPTLNTSKVTNMQSMFNNCKGLTSLPALNAQSLNMPSYYGFFGYSELPNLTDFGGLLNLKCSLTSNNNLKRLPNLTYESCINVLNGLYDFTGNGETPGSNQGQLKVHQNFLDKVGNEISIGINRGWTITA